MKKRLIVLAIITCLLLIFSIDTDFMFDSQNTYKTVFIMSNNEEADTLKK